MHLHIPSKVVLLTYVNFDLCRIYTEWTPCLLVGHHIGVFRRGEGVVIFFLFDDWVPCCAPVEVTKHDSFSSV